MEVIGNIFENPELLNSTPTVKEDEETEEDEDLEKCEQCGENAWDGYICHSCGMKDIGE